MQSLNDLKEKIKLLEDERAHLTVEVEDLRKAAELRVAALENEVRQLRKDSGTLREILRPQVE